LRRSCSITKKQYNTRKVTVGGKEIHSSEDFAVILQKSQPLPLGVPAATDAAQIPGHGSLRDGKTELLQFPMDLGTAPIGIFIGQPHDQVPQFLSNSRSTAARSGAPAPVETKAGAVPCDDGFWFDNQEDIGPAWPKAAEGGPEQPVAGVQGWPRALAFENGELLAEGQNFQGGIGSCPEGGAECNEEGEEELDHELTVLT
jgi:hypothetical protein